MAQITLEGMEFFAYHGCFAEEQIIGTRFMVDVFMEVEVMQACEHDDLHATVDYQSVFAVVKKEMTINSKLIEHVCWRIHNAIKAQFPQILKLTVKVSKMNPPIGGKVGQVSFTLGD